MSVNICPYCGRDTRTKMMLDKHVPKCAMNPANLSVWEREQGLEAAEQEVPAVETRAGSGDTAGYSSEPSPTPPPQEYSARLERLEQNLVSQQQNLNNLSTQLQSIVDFLNGIRQQAETANRGNSSGGSKFSPEMLVPLIQAFTAGQSNQPTVGQSLNVVAELVQGIGTLFQGLDNMRAGFSGQPLGSSLAPPAWQRAFDAGYDAARAVSRGERPFRSSDSESSSLGET